MEGGILMDTSRGLAVLYLMRDGFVLYVQRTNVVVQCRFAQDSVRDVEVRNKESLRAQLQHFIRSNKLLPARILMLLSHEVLFEKQFTDTRQLHREIETERFLETIPFENISRKEYAIDQGYQLVATNREYYETIVALLLEEGFVCEAVVPVSVVKEVHWDKEQSFDVHVAQNLLRKLEALKQHSLLTPHQRGEASTQVRETERRKLMLAVGFFVVAIFLSLLLFLFRR